MNYEPALTIFTTPKPFTGQFNLIQHNALASWRALSPSPEVFIFGDEEGASEAALWVGATHIPEVGRNDAGTPLISAMFEEAQRRAANPVLCYSNADIVLFNDVNQAIAIAEAQTKPYLLTGRRHDTDVTTAVDFCDASQSQALLQLAVERGKKYPPLGMDYFIFRQGSLSDLPDFAVGRPRWDNFMIYYARKRGYLVVDTTDAIFAIHQNHDYSHHAQGTQGVWEGKEAQDNLLLAGGWNHIFTLRNATHTMNQSGLHKASTDLTRYERLNEFSALHPWARIPLYLARQVKHLVRPQPELKPL